MYQNFISTQKILTKKYLQLGTEIMATDHYIEAAAATVADSSATYFHQSGGATYREERR